MSADERFLARWSRRKRHASANRRDGPPPRTPSQSVEAEKIAAADGATTARPVVDLADLPPIESIDAGSDITMFLMPGVPADLMRAALRRAWSTDPAIRDFIGLSENAWDFTATNGVSGFGSLTGEEIRRLLAQLTAEPEAAEVAGPHSEALSEKQLAAARGSAPDGAKEKRDEGADHTAPDHFADENDIAPQHEFETRESCRPLQRRRHGGALPE